MNVPVELFVWLLGANAAFLSLCAHQLLRISAKISTLSEKQALEHTQTRMRLDALERTQSKSSYRLQQQLERT
jgi:hypothetical protein